VVAIPIERAISQKAQYSNTPVLRLTESEDEDENEATREF
jgi:hypothetical protein